MWFILLGYTLNFDVRTMELVCSQVFRVWWFQQLSVQLGPYYWLLMVSCCFWGLLYATIYFLINFVKHPDTLPAGRDFCFNAIGCFTCKVLIVWIYLTYKADLHSSLPGKDPFNRLWWYQQVKCGYLIIATIHFII